VLRELDVKAFTQRQDVGLERRRVGDVGTPLRPPTEDTRRMPPRRRVTSPGAKWCTSVRFAFTFT
jgi:hypothetical protein